MRFFSIIFSVLIVNFSVLAQKSDKKNIGHINDNPFRQLTDLFATPNKYHNASGAPGVDYYQQKVDYSMNIELDDEKKKLYGEQSITYYNNSPDDLEYLWIQLDQNIRKKDAPALEKNESKFQLIQQTQTFASSYIKEPFDGGFNIEWVRDINNNPIKYYINQTMMRIDVSKPIMSGQQYKFKIKWWYNINDHVNDEGRSGYEYFPKDNNRAYVIAQFFPRLCVYNDVEGWQNYQFWGNGEFALEFGDYDVNITVPSDHILDATGVLQNPKEVLSKIEYNRYKKAQNSFEKPVIIVSEDEVIEKEKSFSKTKKTWKFKAKNVRDFAFATSRKFIWDMQAVKIGSNKVMAVSLYPKEGNPLWEEYSTKAVVQSLITYSKFTFDYPYPKAVSVHAKNQGMEYPMICWNFGRPDEDGNYSDRTKFGMISVIIHEIGHNYFPMIVNSDERQWGWMDEGLDTFVQYLTEQEFAESYPEVLGTLEKYPSRRGDPKKIIPYMSGDQNFISPIMSNPENIFQLGANAYAKPATALNILRETIMGRDLFDHAFKTYSKRWMFKHPTPEDFFRTMEDASAVDLDWFWRGWFYTTDFVDIGINSFKKYSISTSPPDKVKEMVEGYGINSDEMIESIYMLEDKDDQTINKLRQDRLKVLEDYLKENNSDSEIPKYFYEIGFEKPGGLVMPIIVKYTYADGSSDIVKYPVQLWRKNLDQVYKVVTSDKEIIEVTLDPNFETSDVNMNNNNWPRKEIKSKFKLFKEKIKG
tara:strand:+ start:4514 stop:6781 length:2268 start_codon:yes stop_codon:yes gene_type:complete